MIRKVLITGGTGFFGKSILDYYSRHVCPYEFTILSRHGFGDKKVGREIRSTVESATEESCHCRPTLSTYSLSLLGDVRTFELPVGAHFDYVIHAATPARADVPDDEMRSIILDGTANAIREAKRCGAEKFMMVSSGGVYGKGFTRPVFEEDEPRPYTAYGIAKLEAERMAVDSGLFTLLPRCFAFVGRHLDRNAHFAIGNFIRDALAGRDIVINGDGTPMRSYMYADDLVEWLFAILERGESGRPYNVGSPNAISIRDLATTVLTTVRTDRRSRNEVEVDNGGSVKVLGAPVPGAANYYVPDCTRIQRELSVRLRYDLAQSILESI